MEKIRRFKELETKMDIIDKKMELFEDDYREDLEEQDKRFDFDDFIETEQYKIFETEQQKIIDEKMELINIQRNFYIRKTNDNTEEITTEQQSYINILTKTKKMDENMKLIMFLNKRDEKGDFDLDLGYTSYKFQIGTAEASQLIKTLKELPNN